MNRPVVILTVFGFCALIAVGFVSLAGNSGTANEPVRVAQTAGAIAPVAAAAQVAQAQPERKIGGFAEGPRMDRVEPGELLVDPPTLENLGFRWYITGDSNRNGRVEVAFRQRGESAWKEAQPFLRVHHEVADREYGPYRTGNLFAGSIFRLTPDTEYEVRLTMSDPDGGAPEPRILPVRTRAVPRAYDGGRRIAVYPTDWKGERDPNGFADLAKAFAAALPGDILLLHPGIHRGSYTLTRSGTLERPIVLRGAGGGTTILEAPDRSSVLFRISGADHIHFEDLTLRRASTAITTQPTGSWDKGGPGATGLVVRNCTIEDVVNGINTHSENSADWYIADNVVTGRDEKWYPRPQQGYMDGSHTGINVYGQGHVVCHNRVSRFSDSIAIANFRPPVDDIRRHAVNMDFYNNDLSFAMDDTFEADYGAHNIRVYRNRMTNAHTGMSTQPLYGGPVYLLRNELYGITSLAYKLNNHPSGIIAYHNTTTTAERGIRPPPIWQNGHFRNNLILGGTGIALDTGSPTPYSTLDYNGYFGTPQSGVLFAWRTPKGRQAYKTLEDFSRGTGHEKNGRMVDYGIFANAAAPKAGVTYATSDYDLRLREGAAAVNAGVRLPNINDDFAGTAPDLGAHERTRPLPHYGPRPQGAR